MCWARYQALDQILSHQVFSKIKRLYHIVIYNAKPRNEKSIYLFRPKEH
jgi:hypothetical protein